MTTWAEAQALFAAVWKEDGAKREPDLKKHKYTPDYRAHMEEWVGFLKAAKKSSSRETFAPESKEQTATVIARFDKTKVPTGRVLHLEDRGWRRGLPQDAGWIWDMHKDLGDGVSAELAIGGGILAGDMRESPAEQELGAITLTTKISSLDPIAFSELVRDVSLLRAQ